MSRRRESLPMTSMFRASRCCAAPLAALLFAVSAPGTAAERAQQIAVIPLPANVTLAGGSFTVRSDTRLLVSGDARAQLVAHYFGDLLLRSRAIRPEIAQLSGTPPKKSITFSVDAAAAGADPESYQLDITSDGIVVAARSGRGLFYGAVTLWQVLTSDPAQGDSIRAPAMRIVDTPRLHWRGLMLDSARHFQSVEYIRQLIDTMALHKLNVLHWHLTDDQAWRLQIRKYPRLTLAGSFYTQEQVRDLVAYANERNVLIVPEIAMPGHATAALVAYPQLAAVAAPQPGSASNLFNLDDATFAFIEDVLNEVTELFPGEFIHIGGAETAIDQWKASQQAQIRMRELGVSNEQLQSYFLQRVGKMLVQRKRRPVGWEYALRAGLPNDAVIMTPRGLDVALSAAAGGYDTVVSTIPALSFDYRQSTAADNLPVRDPVATLEDIYKFDPAPVALAPEDRRHLIGVQANIWTDLLGSEQQIQLQTFPRAAALAEIGWSPPEKQRWPEFIARLSAQMRRYDKLDVRYSDAVFQVRIDTRVVSARDRVGVELSRQATLGEIRYTTNGSEPDAKSPTYADILELKPPITIKAAAFYEGQPLSTTTTAQFAKK
jgi:hexosaminidase